METMCIKLMIVSPSETIFSSLVIKGYLSEFMSNNKSAAISMDRMPTRRDRTPLRQPPPPPHHKIINIIAGGSELCGEIYSQAKRATKEIGV